MKANFAVNEIYGREESLRIAGLNDKDIADLNHIRGFCPSLNCPCVLEEI